MTDNHHIGLTKDQTIGLLSRGFLGNNSHCHGDPAIVAIINTTSKNGIITRDRISQWTIESDNTIKHINSVADIFNMPRIENATIAPLKKMSYDTIASLNPVPPNIEHHLGAEAYLHHANTTMHTAVTQDALSTAHPRFTPIMDTIKQHAMTSNELGPNNARFALRSATKEHLTPEEYTVANNIYNDRAMWDDALTLKPEVAAIIFASLRPNQHGFLKEAQPGLTPEILQMSAAFAGASIGFTRMNPTTEQLLPRPLNEMVDQYTERSATPRLATPTATLPPKDRVSIVIARAPSTMNAKDVQPWSERVWRAATGHDRVRVIGPDTSMINRATAELRKQRNSADVKPLAAQDFIAYSKPQRERILQHIEQHATGVDINIPDITRMLRTAESKHTKQPTR